MKRQVLLLSLLVAHGCSDSSELDRPVIRLEIDAAVDVPEELDELLITLVASRSDDGGDFCETQGPFLIRLSSPEDLPTWIDSVQGDVYSRRLAYRVDGFVHEEEEDGGDQVFRREGVERWPDAGQSFVRIEIEGGCYGELCRDDRQCVDEECARVPAPGVFDDPGMHDPGQPCELERAP